MVQHSSLGLDLLEKGWPLGAKHCLRRLVSLKGTHPPMQLFSHTFAQQKTAVSMYNERYMGKLLTNTVINKTACIVIVSQSGHTRQTYAPMACYLGNT